MMYIKGKKLVGDTRHVVKKIMNFSSIPNEFLKNFLDEETSPRTSKSIKILQINPLHAYDADTVTCNQKRDACFVIVDDDDNFVDIKIRNMMKMMNICSLGKIIVETPTMDDIEIKENGTTINFINHHTPKPIKTVHAALDKIMGQYSEIRYANIIKTSDKTCNGTAGLKWYLKCHDIPWNEHLHVTKAKGMSWLLMPEKELKKISFEDYDVIKDIIPDDDKRWQYRTGYTYYLCTNRGPKVIKTTENNSSGIRHKVPIIKKIFNWLIDKIKEIKNNVIFIFKKVIGINHKTKKKDGLAFSQITNTVPYVYTLGSYFLSRTNKENADKEITKANKMMANWHKSRMEQKPTSTRDKTTLLNRMSDAYASYIVGSMNYNVQDATLTADLKAARECIKIRTKLMLMNISVVSVCTIINGSYNRLPLYLTSAIIAYANNWQTSQIILTGILSPTNIINKTILAILLSLEHYPGIDESFKKKIVPYFTLLVMAFQIFTGAI